YRVVADAGADGTAAPAERPALVYEPREVVLHPLASWRSLVRGQQHCGGCVLDVASVYDLAAARHKLSVEPRERVVIMPVAHAFLLRWDARFRALARRGDLRACFICCRSWARSRSIRSTAPRASC